MKRSASSLVSKRTPHVICAPTDLRAGRGSHLRNRSQSTSGQPVVNPTGRQPVVNPTSRQPVGQPVVHWLSTGGQPV
eukprot:1075217-Prorocentrum_minimum.AAC.2